MRSVLVGVDGSEGALRAAAFAARRARINSWEMTFVHVIHWSPHTIQTLEENEARPLVRAQEIAWAQREVIEPLLEQLKDDLDGVKVSTLISHGRPSEVLADLGEEGGYDLIAVGRTGDGGLREAIFGTTASRLVRYAPVPVVVVP